MTNIYPKTDSKNFVVQNLDKETLIYNLVTNKAASLNETAGFVWNHCDGKTSVEKLTELFNKKFSTNVGADFIEITLDQLGKSELLENNEFFITNKINRRKVLLNYATPMILLPVVASIVAPVSAQASSACGGQSSCTVNTDCKYTGRPCRENCICEAVCFENCCVNEVSC